MFFDGIYNIVIGIKLRINNLLNFVWFLYIWNMIVGYDWIRYKYFGFCLLELCMIFVICIFKVD